MSYYIGFFAMDLNRMMKFYSIRKPTKATYSFFGKVTGPYETEQEVDNTMKVLKRAYGYQSNPAVSERQRRFMCADLGRLCSGRKTVTGMRESQLRDFCRKSNPAITLASKVQYIVSVMKKDGFSKADIQFALDMVRGNPKVIDKIYKGYKKYEKNPGKTYHDRKFMFYLRELGKYKVGSTKYIETLAKAYEHLESAKDSEHELVR